MDFDETFQDGRFSVEENLITYWSKDVEIKDHGLVTVEIRWQQHVTSMNIVFYF